MLTSAPNIFPAYIKKFGLIYKLIPLPAVVRRFAGSKLMQTGQVEVTGLSKEQEVHKQGKTCITDILS